jgi:hypothetical protein
LQLQLLLLLLLKAHVGKPLTHDLARRPTFMAVQVGHTNALQALAQARREYCMQLTLNEQLEEDTLANQSRTPRTFKPSRWRVVVAVCCLLFVVVVVVAVGGGVVVVSAMRPTQGRSLERWRPRNMRPPVSHKIVCPCLQRPRRRLQVPMAQHQEAAAKNKQTNVCAAFPRTDLNCGPPEE